MPPTRACRPAIPVALVSTLLIALLAACSKSPEPAAPAPAAVAPPSAEAAASAVLHAAITPAVAAAVTAGADTGIAWRKPHGEAEVEAAFAEARKAGQPVFVYWGAVWCPPCNQVKATVFTRPDFVAKSRGFVPVYLDGDEPGAQKLGARFKVRGYPTMILFRPDGSELTRLPGEVDAQKYVQVLALGLNAMRPIKQLLAQAQSQPASLSAEEWRLLAYYAWDVDEQQLVGPGQQAALLAKLAAACPPAQAEARARLTLKSLTAQLTDAKAQAKAGAKPARAAPAARETLLALLADPAKTRENLDIVLYYAPDLVKLVSAPGAAREELVAVWGATLDRLTADATLSQNERLSALVSRIALARIEAGEKAPLNPVLLDHVRAQVARADREVTSDVERQAVIDSAAQALADAGLLDESDKLLTAELKRSHSPYYAMLSLAANAKRRGDSSTALDWYERAYAASKGPATRVQWGSSYVNALVDLAPEDSARIGKAASAVLGELKGQPDAFYERTVIRLDRMSGKLLQWQQGKPQRAAVVAELRSQRDALCAALPAEDPQRASCEGLLAPARPARGKGVRSV